MALLNELLQKQERRLQGKDAVPKERVKIARTGATRPWQENLPQYQTQGIQQPKKGEDVENSSTLLPTPGSPGFTTSTGDINQGQTPKQQGTTGDKNGGQNQVNQGQTAKQQGTTGDKNGGQNQVNQGQTAKQQGTTGDKNGGQNQVNQGQTAKQQGTTPICPPISSKLSPVNLAPTCNSNVLVPGLGPTCPPLEPGTVTNANEGHFPTAPQEVNLLFCLVKEMEQTGLGTTRVLKNDDLADMAKIKRTGFKRVRARLIASGHCTRRKAGEGRSKTAGCIYAVSDEAISAFHNNRGQRGQSTGDKEGTCSDSSSRSLDIEKATTKADDRRSWIERFDLLVENIGIDPKYKVDGTDLLGWWQKVEKEYGMDIEDFEESLERWTFKVNAAPIREGVSPKAVLAGKILSGPCGRPTGFVSRSDQKAQELAQMRSERFAKARRQVLSTYNDDFEIWFAEADDEALLQCVPQEDGQRKSVQPAPGSKLQRSLMLRGLVRARYANNQGIDLAYWDHLVDELG